MRRRARKPRSIGRAALWVLAAVAACAGGNGFSGPAPTALLPSSTESAAAFEALRSAWVDMDAGRTPPSVVRATIEAFLTRFPHDELAPVARVGLALVALREGDFATADAQIAKTAGLPTGTAHDLWTVARAERERLRGRPDEALSLLRPLVGKIVDPLTRSTFSEELTLAALATHREYEAIGYMDAWLRASAEDDRPAAAGRVRAIVERLPTDILVGAFETMRAQRSKLGYGVEIQRIVTERLVQIATATADAQLARMLLDADVDVAAYAGDAGVSLGELANSRRGLNVIEGRTIGLLLPTASPDLRDESADVLRGVMWALGLPRGARAQQGSMRIAAAADGGRPAATDCGAPEPAPEPEEPSAAEDLRLVTRDDTGSSARTEVSLDELAGEGAAVVIAGLDAETSARALRWGESHAMPVIALVAPEATPDASSASFGFTLGEPRTDVLAALGRALPALEEVPVRPVVDASEIALLANGGARASGLTLLPATACDVAATRAGEPRFPVSGPRADALWLVTGSPECAADVVSELAAARVHTTVALTLEAAATPAHPAALRVLSARAGVIPEAAPRDPREDEVDRFRTTLGPLGWWTALGRDASSLARLAVRTLPARGVTEPQAVAERRAAARDALASVKTRLWTTEASGWGGRRTMRRTVCVLDVPPR